MAINKNFVVKNGLEVSDNLVVKKSVGISTSDPNYDLDVKGSIGANELAVSGLSTFSDTVMIGDDGMTLTSSPNDGFTGIGTADPKYPLEIRTGAGQTALYVSGNVKFDGNLDTNLGGTINASTANIQNIISNDINSNVIDVGNIQIKSGIVTSNSVSGIVTYYGDGSNLQDVELRVGTTITLSGVTTEGAPAIKFQGDEDTGMFRSDANELSFSTGGKTRLRITSQGKIVDASGAFIGGTNPDFDNAQNVVIYVNQSDKNASDAEDNDGGNINRPFKTIERALLEASVKSYVADTGGLTDNDKFEAYTIMVFPGDYTIDNRPGYDVTTDPIGSDNLESNIYRFNPKNGGVIVPRGTSVIGYDLRKTVIRPKYVPDPLQDHGSILADDYKVSGILYDAANMIEKGRGYIQEQAYLFLRQNYSSVVTAIQTRNPLNPDICKRDIGYFIDGIINDLRNGGNEYSYVVGEFYTLDQDNDGVDEVSDNRFLESSSEVNATIETFQKARDIMKLIIDNNLTSYTEISSAGGVSKTVSKPNYSAGTDYSSNGDCTEAKDAVDTLTSVVTTIIQNPDNYTGDVKKITAVNYQTSIFKVTGGCYFWQMTFKDAKINPFKATTYVSGVPTFTQATSTNYSHHRVVCFSYADQRTQDGELERYYDRINSWINDGTNRITRPEEYTIVGDSSKKTTIDTVNSCSPYIFNCSLRSTLGLCGMHTDGSKVKESSFKSMVVAQFTGISLQKDQNAYWQPLNKSGKVYTSSSTPTTLPTGDSFRNVEGEDESSTNRGPIYADPDAEYKHQWRHFHIKASNSAFIQVVSVFAVGYADQFLAVNGGDMSITNSNSNFGQISLRSVGHKFEADPPSAYGKITALIPPAGIEKETQYVEIYPIAAKSTWEVNLGDTATKAETDWASSKTKFSTSGNSLFKLYLEIPGVQKEDDIPELVVETVDNNTGDVKVKRFLTFGSSNNYNLFREYYNNNGELDEANCKIINQVDGESGGLSVYEAVIDTSTPAPDIPTGGTDPETKNHERVGYYWDKSEQKVYLKLDSDYSSTRTYVSEFIFSSVIETTFVTEAVTNDDGSVSVISTTRDINVLQYWDGFPGSVTSAKLVDSRASDPNSLLWRVKYVIPKDYRDAEGKVLSPKPPEKRFIIKGTNIGNDPDGIPYTNYRFTVWDVQEIQTWERPVTGVTPGRDGEYYLTILRSDIDRYIDGDYGSGYSNSPYTLERKDSYDDIESSELSGLSFDDPNYRVTSNVNYLYPSINEEGNITNPRILWNPPQMDSRVIVERVGSNGLRTKDVSVPNKKYHNSSNSNTPFYEVPALTSVTAEAVHRLVYALDLCYVKESSTTTTNVKVSPVTSWDSRSSKSTYNTIATNFNIYGTAGNAYRYGDSNLVIKTDNFSDFNTYGIISSEEERKIPVCGKGISGTISSSSNNDSDQLYAVAPIVPLLRPSILRASSHTWEYIGIGPGNYSTGFPNLQTRVLKAYEQFIAQGYENAGGFVASSGTNSAGDFYIGNQVIQAGGQSTTTLNVPKVRKSSESNAVDISDLENRVSNNVVNVIPSVNKSSAQQNLLKGLSNFFTTARLTVSDRANIQTLYVTDRVFISNSSILNGEKFPEGGPEGYGFTKGARPEKTGYIATDTNDRLYVSPKFLDAWRIKKKILSASNINLDNNRIYVEPLSRTFTSSLQNDSSDTVALSSPIQFAGTMSVTSGVATLTISTSGIISNLYVGMKIGGSGIVGEATITSKNDGNLELTLEGATFTAVTSSGSFYAVDTLRLVDSSGMPPFGRVDIEMSLDYVSDEDYIDDGTVKRYFNPNINISLQYDNIDYTNNVLYLSSTQNYAPFDDYVNSVLPEKSSRNLHTIIKNYSPVMPNIGNDEELSDTIKYLRGSITANVASTIVDEAGTHSITTTSTQIGVNADFWNKLPTRGAVTLRYSSGGELRYSTYVYFKKLDDTNNKICLLRKIDTQSNNDSTHTYSTSDTEIYFTGCKSYISFGDKWAVENGFIPDVEEISEDVDIESATLYELPVKPIPYTGKVDTSYTESIVPNPVTSKALGANLQTKRTVKTFQPFENLKQVADFSKEQGFTSNDTVELIMKPGYYRLYSDGDSNYGRNITFPCKLKINGSGVKKTNEQYSKELANTSAGRIGGYSLNTVKSGDSVSFFRSPQIVNSWGGRTDLLYISNIGDILESTGGIEIENVHFLGLNEAITRNEILDNAYSSDEFLISARRRVRKAWYVKQADGFPQEERGVVGGLSFQTKYGTTADSNGGTFNYYLKTDEFTDSNRVKLDPTVSTDTNTLHTSKNARYLKLTFNRSDFTTANQKRFDWMIEYIIPGTTMYYIPNNSSPQDVVASTKKTRVLDVTKNITTTGGVTSVSSFDIHVALYDPTTSSSSADEDMDLITGVTNLSNGIQCVFENRDGDEFVIMVYNWCKQKRYQIFPKSFTTSGEGYDNTEYDEPRIYGIIAGYKTDTLNIVVDTHPSAEQGGVNTFSRTGTPTSGSVDTVFENVAATGGSGTGAKFKVEIEQVTDTYSTYNVSISDPGENYKVDDVLTLTISGNNNITITIGTIEPTKKQYPAHTLFNFYPTIMVDINGDENCGFTIPVYPNGYRRLYGRQNTRYYLFEVNAADISGYGDNNGHNTTISSLFSGFGYSDIDSDETTSITVGTVTFTEADRKRTTFTSDQQFEAIAKYNLWKAGFGYKETNPTTNTAANSLDTIGRKIFINYSTNYKVTRKKFPTSAPPSVGNLGATLIKVSGIPGSSNLVTLKNVTIGAMSDANDISNTYGGAYHGGIISIENGQVDLRGVRFRGNLSLDWSGLLCQGSSRLTADNKFTYGHSVDLLETSGIIKVNRFGDNKYTQLNVSKEDINFKYYTMYRDNNNLYLEPNKLPSGVPVDYDQRTFPITTVNAITKFNSSGNLNTTVELNERYLTDEIIHDNGTATSYSGQNLRFNNSAQVTIVASTPGGHSDSSRNLLPKHITFTLPYSTAANQNAAEEVAKNIVPNFTKIIRANNPDSVLATVASFEYYKKTVGSTTTAYFVIKYTGNIEYLNQQDTTTSDASGIGGGIDFSGFELQLLTNYIPSQRFNYVSTLTTRYIKRSNADGTQYSKYEIGYDDAQKKSIFANPKDFVIEKVGSGQANISRASGTSANILHFKKGTAADSDNDVKVILETDANGEVLSCDVVSLGIGNAPDEVLYYPSSADQKYKITMTKTVTTRNNATDTDYEMFAPGEVVNCVENSSFIVNNFVQTSLTGIKSALQKVKSIIAPGSYIEYGGQYYKVAYNTPGRPYLGIYRYVNPNNEEDIRTSVVIRLEELTYNISYTRTRNSETITRFDLYEDDNVLRYWPDNGRLEIGELELCDFEKRYINKNFGYRITLTRSNTKFWPSYIHDWDGLQIAEALPPTDDADNPAEAPPNIATGTLSGTSIRLADPVDTTCSTYKRVKSIGEETLTNSYMSKTGILSDKRAFVDIYSGADQLDDDLNRFEVGQIISLPWRSLNSSWHKRGSSSPYDYSPSQIVVKVDAPRGTKGTSGSTNRAGDSKISVIISSTKESDIDITGEDDTKDGIIRLTNNLRGLHQILNKDNVWASASGISKTTHSIYDKIDPLTSCRTTRSIGSILGKPHSDNNAVNIASVNASERTFTITQTGSNPNVGKGLVPGIVIKKDGVLEKDTRISSVSRTGSAGSYTYTIKFNKNIISGQTLSGTVTFTNEIYTDMELFNPILSDFSEGDEFKIIPQFNTEPHPWDRFTEVFTSRIADIQKIGGTDNVIRLHLSDPFTYGNSSGNSSRIDTRFITQQDSRYFGFISINHGGWSFPRSGGSYVPSNIVQVTNDQSTIKVLNRSGRIKAGDTLKYTYEANTVLQEISRSSVSDFNNRNRFLLRGITVEEGDSLIGFDISANSRYGVKDKYRKDGTYTVYHKKYTNSSGDLTDNYRFGNSSQNSFWNGSGFTENQPTTKYIYNSDTYYVDIGGGVSLSGDSQTYSGVTQTALDNDNDLGVYEAETTDQNTGDPWTRSLVRTNGSGRNAEISLTVSGNEITGVTIDDGGTGYKVNDWILIVGAVFNADNPRYPQDVYLYVSDVSSGGVIVDFQPRILLINEVDSTDQIQIGYDSSTSKWVKYNSGPDDASGETKGTTELEDQNAIYIETVEGSWVYLKAQLTKNNELLSYRFERVGGFTAGQKLIFSKPKPSSKLVSGTITNVSSTLDSDGYATLTLDSPDNILYNSYGGNKSDWLSVSDVLISHSSDLFGNDGPLTLRFMHSEFGGTMEFEAYRVWNDWYRNGSENKGFGLYGSHGWVGNFGRTTNGIKPIGMTSTGSLVVNWGRQRQNSIWKIAQPVRPAWTHLGLTGDVIYNGAAFTPAFRYFYTNGTNTFYSTSLLQYLLEDNQVFDSAAYLSPIKHVSNNTDAINATLATYNKYLREDWWSGRYYEGGMGPLSYQPYQWSSTFDSLNSSRLAIKNKISYQLQDLKFRDNPWGDIQWGSGNKARLTEIMVTDYVQHYSLGPTYANANHFIDPGIKVKLASDTGYWENHRLVTDTAAYTSPSSASNRNLRVGILISSAADVVKGKRYIIKDSTTDSYVSGQLWTAPADDTWPSGVTSGYLYESKIARGDAIYLSSDGGTTKTFVGFVRYVDGGASESTVSSIYLTQPVPSSFQTGGDFNLYYVRPSGLKAESFDSAYSQIGDADPKYNKKGDNVFSASMPGALDYNMSFVIGKRNYNTSPILNTVGDVKPVGNMYWYWGSTAGYKSIRVQFGDLSSFNWSLMNINITRFNNKVHLESAVTATASSSSIGVNTIYI